MLHPRTSLSLLCLSVLLLAGCDDGGDGSSASATATTGSTADATDDATGTTAVDLTTTDATASTTGGPGPAAGLLLTDQFAPYDIALGGGHVYFTQERSVYRVPVNGGAVEEMYNTGSDMYGTYFVGADSERFVWTSRAASPIVGGVQTCPHSGCPAVPDGYPHHESTSEIEVSGPLVAWVSGSTGTVEGMLEDSGQWTSENSSTPISVAIDGIEVFWVAGDIVNPHGVFTCTPAGSTCSGTMINGEVESLEGIAVRGDHVVVIGATGVFDMRRDGSGLVKLADVTGVKNIYSDDIVTDGVDVYWSNDFHLYGCRLDDCTPTLLADAPAGQGNTGLAIDEDAIYWATSAALRRFER